MKKYWYVVRQEWLRLFTYRYDFWIHFLGTILVNVSVSWFLWKSIFSQSDSTLLKDYSFQRVIFYYLLVPIVERGVRGTELTGISSDIYEGGLSKYLVYPMDYFLYRYVIHFAQTAVFTLQIVIVAAYIFIQQPFENTVSFSLVAQFFIFLMAGNLVYFVIATVVELMSFWMDHVWSLLVSLRFVLLLAGGGLLPLSFFPDTLQSLLYWTPFPYMTFVPLEILIQGRVPVSFLSALSVLFLWFVLATLVLQFLWRRGLRHYSGVGM